MNIKSLVKSQRVRHLIMRTFKWVPDSVMLRLQYYILLRRWPNLKHPRRFTEWIQVYKMKYRNPDMLRCVDKFKVRKYVEEKGCSDILNDLYQVCQRAEGIDFDSLPEKFIIKTTSGGSGDNVLIVTTKTSFNRETAVKKVNSWLNKNYSDTSREWAYSTAAKDPLIIVEKYLENSVGIANINEGRSNYMAVNNITTSTELFDYKFFCFNGKCRYFKVDFNRFTHHQANYYNADGELINVIEDNYKPDSTRQFFTDEKRIEMITTAEKLASDFPFARVDLYNINGKVIFGELTFYPASGYTKFTPDEFDFEIGQFFPDNL